MLLVNAKQMEIDGINILFRIVAYTVGAVIDIRGCTANSNFRISDFAFQDNRSFTCYQMERDTLISVVVIDDFRRSIFLGVKPNT